MTLEAWQWGNPEVVLERKQEAQAKKVKQCGDCIHATTVVFKGEPWCTVRFQTYGYRCKFYEKAKHD